MRKTPKVRKQGRRFDEDAKVRAVRLFLVEEEPAVEVAKVCGTTEVSVRKWAKDKRLRRLAKAA